MRKLVGTLAAVAIAVVGVVALVAFFNSRDESTTESEQPATTTSTAPAGAEDLLAAGNVLIRFSRPEFAAPLERLATELGAPDTPELRATGQAVVVRPASDLPGIVAQAQSHELRVATPSDPALQEFVERWLGVGEPG